MDEQKWPKEQVDQILAFVERIVDKKIASDSKSHHETTSVNIKNARGGYWALIVTLGIGVAGLLTNTYLENRDRDDKVIREANRRKLEIIAGISNAITSMRELKDLILLSCGKDLSQAEKLKINEERLRTSYELVKVSRPMLHFFNQKFRSLIVDLLAWDDSIPDYCDPSAPSEAEWLKKQKQIEENMVLAPASIFADLET